MSKGTPWEWDELEWVTVSDMPGAEHYVAQSGWMLARVQRGPGHKCWLWSVSTHARLLISGDTDKDVGQVKGYCHTAVIDAYLDLPNHRIPTRGET